LKHAYFIDPSAMPTLSFIDEPTTHREIRKEAIALRPPASIVMFQIEGNAS
jgi:hypothetical protein